LVMASALCPQERDLAFAMCLIVRRVRRKQSSLMQRGAGTNDHLRQNQEAIVVNRSGFDAKTSQPLSIARQNAKLPQKKTHASRAAAHRPTWRKFRPERSTPPPLHPSHTASSVAASCGPRSHTSRGDGAWRLAAPTSAGTAPQTSSPPRPPAPGPDTSRTTVHRANYS